MLNHFLDMLFPQEKCSLCRKPGKYYSKLPWCQECLDRMLELQCSGSTCQKCGKYLPGELGLCADCRLNPPPFEISRAVGPYEEQYRLATKVLKFMGKKYLAQQMGAMMAAKIGSEPNFEPIDLIVPVPIAPNSLQVRGFNQTALLAKQIGKQLGIKVDYGVIVRVKDTPHQTELSREEREKNLLQAFAVKAGSQLAGKSVLLVDDVYTTGSTARECTRVLLEAGAKRVCIITWATGRGF
ncbi:MAG: ComF family protein [Firmicutes bacterium]|nr:ComF family protein [Bacillota bacterium]